MTQRCPVCGEEKQLSEFRIQRCRRLHRDSICRECRLERTQQRRQQFLRGEIIPDSEPRICTRCGRTLPASMFSLEYGGRGLRKVQCRECYSRNQRRGIPKSWRNQITEARFCVRARLSCGESLAPFDRTCWLCGRDLPSVLSPVVVRSASRYRSSQRDAILCSECRGKVAVYDR